MTTRTQPTIRPARLAVLVLALGQLISPVFFYLGNSSLQADAPGEPPIVPAGYSFAIWAVICVVGAAYGLWQLPTRGPERSDEDRVLDQVAWPLAGVFAGFSIWLVFASAGLSWFTVGVFATMLALQLLALRTAHAARSGIAGWSKVGRLLLWGVLGVYAGWTSVAVWINLTTAVADAGAPVTGPLGTLGQAAVLVAATAAACAITTRFDGLLPLAGAAGWALLGAAVGAAAEAPLLAGIATGGLLALIAVTLASRRSAASPSTT